jgi:predicted nucleotidyltransferase
MPGSAKPRQNQPGASQMKILENQKALRKLPGPHREFLEKATPALSADPRILGLAIGGSFLLGEMDEFSDLDMVVYIDPQHYQSVLAERTSIIQEAGSLLESFSGEHVGEPRLLICLFGPPLLHVDFKFVSMNDIADKVENPTVLWERGDRISSQVNLAPAEFPRPDKTWIEKRFWTWVHYAATKIGRGEIFEAVETIGFLRAHVFGPLILEAKGARPQGLRKLEFHADEKMLKRLKNTMAEYDAKDCLRALHESAELYRELRQAPGNQRLEKLVLDYLNQIKVLLS